MIKINNLITFIDQFILIPLIKKKEIQTPKAFSHKASLEWNLVHIIVSFLIINKIINTV